MITTGGIFGGLHTYTDLHMIPKSPIVFAPPAPKVSKIDVPCADGELDLTEMVSGSVFYANRKGSLEFLVLEQENVSWQTVYSQALAHFHGQCMRVVLDDDAGYFYNGRFAVNDWKSNLLSSIVIEYDLDPYKYPLSSIPASSNHWWEGSTYQNVMSSLTLDIEETQTVGINNLSTENITPIFYCSVTMSVTFGGTSYTLLIGENANTGIELVPGENIMTFTGTGRVTIDYTGGRIL